MEEKKVTSAKTENSSGNGIGINYLDFEIIRDPTKWQVSRISLHDPNGLCKYNRIMKVTYGFFKGAPTSCFMRESIYQAICAGSLIVLPADNETGFVVVDRITKLAVPRLKINSASTVL